MFDYLKEKEENLVFDTLKIICEENGWVDLETDIKLGLEDCSTNQNDATTEISDDNDLDISLHPVRENLIQYLRDDVEAIFKYWDNLGATLVNPFKNFYNPKITIEEKSGKIFSDISSFEELFENQKFKRIVVTAPAGYGKTTFVHEMVRNWVNASKLTSQFRFVFLLRLGEIKNDGTAKFTMRDLFEKCLVKNNSAILLQQTENDHKLCDGMLFVFDGFDEMNENLICKDVMDIILGKSNMKPYVVVTSRPEKCVEKMNGQCNVYVDLKGFTEMGSNEQLKKFNLAHLFNTVEKDILKVPLFCTLVSILQQTGEVRIKHHHQLIEQTLDYMINRHKIVHTDFSDDDKKELFLQLGRYALPYSVKYPSPDVNFDETPKHKKIINHKIVNIAISVNLIMPTSSENEIYFPHRMFADYFAAFYFKENNSSINCQIIHKFLDSYVCVNKLRFIKVDSWFIYFLSHFNEKFKFDLWKLLETYKNSDTVKIPIFDEYDKLPSLNIVASRVRFGYMPTKLVSCVARKLNVPSTIWIEGGTLDVGFEFKNKFDIREVTFMYCYLITSGAELLKCFNHVTSMSFEYCKILGANNSGEINSVGHISANDKATFYPTLFDLSESLMTIYIVGQIEHFTWIKDLKRSDINAYIWLTNSGIKNHFSDLRKLKTFFEDYKDQSESCDLYLTRDTENLPFWLR